MIAEHELAMDGAGPVTVEQLLTALAAAFPASRLNEAEAGARLQLYGDALADIPLDILKGALQQAVKVCKFFPTVAEIRELAGPAKSVRAWRLMALKYMAARHDREWKPAQEPLTPEQSTRAKEMGVDPAHIPSEAA